MLKKQRIFIKFMVVCLLLCGGCSWYFQRMLMEKIFTRATDPSLDPAGRAQAEKELVDLGKPAAGFLVFKLVTGSVSETVPAAEILAKMGREAVDPLCGVLPALKGRRLIAALEALGNTGDRGIVMTLTHYTSHENWRVRRSALKSLNRLGGQKETDFILKAAADPCPFVRLESVRFIQEHPSMEGEAVLLSCLNDDSYVVRFNAASALSAYADSIIPRLQDILQSVSSREKLAFMETLKLLPPGVSDESLTALLADPDWSVRGYAALALAQSGRKARIPLLEERLEEENNLFARERIVEALAICRKRTESGQPRGKK